MTGRKWAVGAVFAVAGLGVGIYSTQDGSAASRPLIVTAEVTHRTIQDQLTLTGTLSRLVQRTVRTSTSAEVGTVSVSGGSTISAGEPILGLNGREMVAEPGSIPFFRSLAVGDSGQDVEQLDRILASSGYDPGPVSTSFTTQTEAALARWQTAHGYPGVDPVKAETLGLSLEPSAFYTVGPVGAAGFTIDTSPGAGGTGGSGSALSSGASAASPSQAPSGAPSSSAPSPATSPTRPAANTASVSSSVPAATPDAVLDSTTPATAVAQATAAEPSLTIYALDTVTTKGNPAVFVVYASSATSAPLSFKVAEGGSTPSDEVLPPLGPFTIPAGSQSVEVQVPTRVNGLVQPKSQLSLQLQPGTGYQVGNPGSAATTVESPDVPKLTVSGGGTIVAGGAATFTITADQPPVVDTTVSFQLTGTAQAGQDYEPVSGSVLLPAGASSVTVSVNTVNRGVVFEPTDMITGSWPIRIGQVSVKPGDVVAPGGELFTLTDSNFTVTLSASASDRTQLKVGQRATVQLQGGTAQASGVISELDDNVTVDPQTNAETYQGKISVGDLGAADGATVSIKVDVNAANDVLAVPIAAVEQNGAGQDVVRVIDLAHGGHVTDVPVRTGLSDSSYIEIDSGLSAGQVVIVDEIAG